MVSICMLSCHQPVPSMRLMRERSRFFSSVRRLMNMSTCSACSLWYRKVTMRSFSLTVPSSRCTGSIIGVPSETTSTMRAFSSSQLTASAIRAVMRGLSTRGAGTGRGVLGGVGRTCCAAAFSAACGVAVSVVSAGAVSVCVVVALSMVLSDSGSCGPCPCLLIGDTAREQRSVM